MFSKKMIIIVVVVAVAAVGGLMAGGYLTPDEARRLGRDAYYRSKGTVKGAVESVTTVTASSSGDPRKAAACRANLRRIETAKRSVANRLALPSGEVPESEVKADLGGSLPDCPDGGRYHIKAINFLPTCTIGPGVVSDPNDDHVITSF